MERKIGEIIEFDDTELKVVEITKEERQANESCAGCYFFHEDTRECSEFKEDEYAERTLGSCYENKRTDKKSVKFIKVRKREVPTREMENLKISCWKDLIGVKLVTTRGLYAKVIKKDNQYIISVFLIESAFAPIAVIGCTPTLKDTVDMLRKFGFDLEYEAPFNLVEFLRENLCKQTFKVDDFNYYFMIYNDKILLNRETDVQIIGTLYVKLKLKDIVTTIERNFEIITTIERKLEEEKVTKIQLIDALEELGWM